MPTLKTPTIQRNVTSTLRKIPSSLFTSSPTVSSGSCRSSLKIRPFRPRLSPRQRLGRGGTMDTSLSTTSLLLSQPFPQLRGRPEPAS